MFKWIRNLFRRKAKAASQPVISTMPPPRADLWTGTPYRRTYRPPPPSPAPTPAPATATVRDDGDDAIAAVAAIAAIGVLARRTPDDDEGSSCRGSTPTPDPFRSGGGGDFGGGGADASWSSSSEPSGGGDTGGSSD